MAGKVRQPINVEALEDYLHLRVPEIELPIELKQFGFGQSNPTYQITSRGGVRYVLRKKPPGKLLSKAAHKVEREYRVMTALNLTDFPVPKTYCLCEEETVIETPFYLMEFLDGRILEDISLTGVAPAERTSLWRAAVHNLAKLHSIDFRKIGLDSYGKSDRFYDRQLTTWKQISASQSKAIYVDSKQPIGPIPHFNEMLQFFADKKLQPKERASLIHGDYKLDNLVYHKTQPRIIGVLDWEMSTIGHPLSDLANILNGFYTVNLGLGYLSPGFLPGVTPGLPTADMVVDWYVEVAGWDPRPELTWAVAFSIFRLAAICQGIAARVAARQANTNEQAKQYADAFRPLGEFAWEMVRKIKEETDNVRVKL